MIGKESLVSVIIPAYNVSDSIIRCLDSVYEQTYQNLEVIVVNDGSTDQTLSLVEEYGKTHEGLVVIDQPNRGLSGARNSGLDVARGLFVFFLDSDDYLGPNEIEMLANGFADSSIDMVVGGMKYVDPSGNVQRVVCGTDQVLDEYGYWRRLYFDEFSESVQYVVSWGKLFRKSVFSDVRFDEGKIHEDEFILHELLSHCRNVRVVECSELYYVQNAGSISHSPSPTSLLDVTEAFIGRNEYFLGNRFFDYFWRSLCQSKAALINAGHAASTQENNLRWSELRCRWKSLFVSGFRHFDFGNRDCISAAIYFAAPFLFR